MTTNKAAEIDEDEIEPTVESEDSEEALAKNLASAMVNGVPKNFRQQADMEAFYRFVHENDLRDEALAIFDKVREEKNEAKNSKRVKH